MIKVERWQALLLIAPVGLLLAGCGNTLPSTGTSQTQAQGQGEVVVFAASSLQDAFGPLASSLKQAPADQVVSKVTYSFAGSQVLATQLGQGARADVFASADDKTMQTAISEGVVDTGAEQPLVTNRLVVIVSKVAAGKITGLGDLVKPGTKIVLADQSVPAGNYSLQALKKLSSDKAGYGASYERQVMSNVVSKETNVRQVVAKVQLGEADAGIVYATDARAAEQAAPQAISTIDIPGEFNVLAQYYIAPLKNAPHPEAARRFIAYVRSAEGQKVLQSFGFGPPEGGSE